MIIYMKCLNKGGNYIKFKKKVKKKVMYLIASVITTTYSQFLFLCYRINVGGKVLTNHLKEVISYRQLHVMDETYVINQVKEDVCYVSQQFYKDMEITK